MKHRPLLTRPARPLSPDLRPARSTLSDSSPAYDRRLARSLFPDRRSLRRPLCISCLALVLILSLSRLDTSRDDALLKVLQKADSHYMTIRGLVAGREVTSSGYRLQIRNVSFPDGKNDFYSALTRRMAASFPEDGRILVYTDQPDIFRQAKIGCRLSLYGKMSVPARAANPGQFDSYEYYRVRKIHLTMKDIRLEGCSPPEAEIAPAAVLRMLLNFLTSLRAALRSSSEVVFGQPYCSLIDAMVLGDRSGLSMDTKRLFEEGGIMHILAVSSLHVTLFGMAVYRALRKLRRSFILSSALSAFVVLSYVLMSGCSISAQRALIMFLFWLGAEVSGQKLDRLTSLCVSAALILVRQPYALTDSGFLLSFGCILSLELLPRRIQKILPVRTGIGKSLISSLSLQLGILPLQLWFFYQLTPLGILLNLIVLPSMSLFMIFGVLGAFLGLLASPFPGFLAFCRMAGGPCRILIDLYLALCRLSRYLPGSVLVTGRPSPVQVILYFALLALLMACAGHFSPASSPPGRKQSAAFCAGAFLLILILCVRPAPHFRFTCLDIGQGSCNLIEYRGLTVLFDAGSSSVEDVYRYRIEPTLKYYGIRRIDLCFLSHGDLDHVNGIEQMMEAFRPSLVGGDCSGIRIGEFLLPDLPEETGQQGDSAARAQNAGSGSDRLLSIRKYAEAWQIPAYSVGEGSCFQYKDLDLQVLSPSPDRLQGSANEDCIVLLMTCGKLRVLFTGDLEKEGEALFVQRYRGDSRFTEDGSPTILIAGHHGSKNATSADLLQLVRPDAAFISCGKNNRYNHPAPAMLSRLQAAGVPWHRTDLEGAIVLTA